MKKKRSKKEEHENVERWMVSYADFVTLLFCFFTAMYAISNIDTNKLGKFVDSMRSAFNVEGARGNAVSVIEGVQIFIPADVEVESNVNEILGTLVTDSKGAIDVKRDERGVVVSVSDKYFFESGSAELKEDSREVLDKIALALLRSSNMIRVEGHTDNIPIHNKTFPSNWELSAYRAINVVKYFINNHKIKPERISAIGYADNKPVASNDVPDGRAKNRRVDIVLLSSGESKKEPR
ncbi:MAG: OmpA family protein [Nitrospirota bacterium]